MLCAGQGGDTCMVDAAFVARVLCCCLDVLAVTGGEQRCCHESCTNGRHWLEDTQHGERTQKPYIRWICLNVDGRRHDVTEVPCLVMMMWGRKDRD